MPSKYDENTKARAVRLLNRPRFYAHFLCWEGWRDAEQV
ncbi:hypothetical protein VIMS_03310 [Mycobacterium marinum]|nr:hypothetical protein VIMS_03310 [Mycobacterium marinum]